MADLSTAQRTWYRHPAHRTVGVSGVASPLRSWRGAAQAIDEDPATRPMRVSLVSRGIDGPGRAAPALFERVLRGQGNMRCRRVDFADAKNAADADCVVVFGRDALLIADAWSSINADILTDTEPVFGISDCDVSDWGDEFRAEVEVAGSAWWHPIIEGVRPFVSRFRRNQIVEFFQDESCLFVGRTADEVFPVVWARCDVGRVFGTLLGSAEDFCRPEFVRLALNALDWVGSRR